MTFISLEQADLAEFISTSRSPSMLSLAMLNSSLETVTLGTFFFLLDIYTLNLKYDEQNHVQRKKLPLEMFFSSINVQILLKKYENKLHLLRQNDVTSCFFSNLNCFSLIIDSLNKKSNTTIIFSVKNYP